MNQITKKSDDKKDKFEEEISNFFEDLMYDYGGSPLLGRIFGLCVIKGKENIFQKDLQDIFNVNPSTISRNLKELESRNLLSKRREPGNREWQYQFSDTSFLELFLHNFEETKIKLEEKQEELLRIKERWNGLVPDDIVFQRLKQLIEWIKVVESEVDEFILTLNKKFLQLEKRLMNES